MQSLCTLSPARRVQACAGSWSISRPGFENLLQRFFFIWLVLIGPAGALAESAGQNDDGSLIASDGMLQTLIAAEALPVLATAQLDWQPIRTFYSARNNKPVWTIGNRLREDAWYAIKRLTRAHEEGLLPGEYHLDEVLQNINLVGQDAFQSVELMLTDGMLRYLRHLRTGRLEPQAVDPKWHISRPTVDPVVLLTAVTESPSVHDALRQLIPSQAGYLRLKKLLRDYRALDSNGGWPVVPPGDSGPGH